MGIYCILTLVDNNLLTIANTTFFSEVIFIIPCPKDKHVFERKRTTEL